MRSERSPGRATLRRWRRWAAGPFGLDCAMLAEAQPLVDEAPVRLLLCALPASLQAEVRLAGLAQARLLLRERSRCAAGLVPTQVHPLFLADTRDSAWWADGDSEEAALWLRRPNGRLLVADLLWREPLLGWRRWRLGRCANPFTAEALFLGAKALGWGVEVDRGAALWPRLDKLCPSHMRAPRYVVEVWA